MGRFTWIITWERDNDAGQQRLPVWLRWVVIGLAVLGVATVLVVRAVT